MTPTRVEKKLVDPAAKYDTLRGKLEEARRMIDRAETSRSPYDFMQARKLIGEALEGLSEKRVVMVSRNGKIETAEGWA